MTVLPRFVRQGRGLPAFAALTVASMVLVILWGAVVRATGSGAGCGAHWPLCNGEVLPHHPRLATLIEFTHRATSGICSTLSLLVIVWTFLARRRGDRSRKAAVASGVLIVTEALLGRALVLHGWVDRNTSDMRAVMQCIHFTNTLLLLAAFTLTWWWLRQRGSATSHTDSRAATVIALVCTVVVGATGSVAALADTLFPAPSLRDALAQDFSSAAPLLVRMRWMHPAAAVLGALCVVWLCFRVRSMAGNMLLGLLAAQLLLGAVDVLLLAPVWLQVLHLLGADLYWIVLVILSADLLPRPATQPAGTPEFALPA